jgi:hypothetical protein
MNVGSEGGLLYGRIIILAVRLRSAARAEIPGGPDELVAPSRVSPEPPTECRHVRARHGRHFSQLVVRGRGA